MRQLVFTNALGRSIAFNSYGLYLALSIVGLGDIPVQNETQKAPGQDGVTWLDATFDTRLINVQGVINVSGEDNIYNARAEMASILNPKLGPGTLVYYAGRTSVRALTAQASLPSFPEKATANTQLYLVRFEGVDPYWYETSYNTQELGGWEPMTVLDVIRKRL